MSDMAVQLSSVSGDVRAPHMLPIAMRGLSLLVDGAPLINGLDLTLADSGLTVVMGPNGAGKSLLLRLLNGLIPPTAGEIRFGGRPLDIAQRQRQALVFQKPVLLRRSVAANIDFVLRARGDGVAGRDALLSRVGLSDKHRQLARLLSGGEQQRLALARALATRPEVLFLDEPTASLDPASVMKIEDIVRNEKDSGTKVVFVTHDTGQARRLADDVVFLHRGRLAEHSPADRFFDHPSSDPARAYLAGRIVL